MKVLLVEDSPTLRHAMGKHITEAGHELLMAESGEEALQLVEKIPVELVFMDVEMPGLNGYETTRLIREWLGEHWIPIIFITSHTKETYLTEGIDSGGDDYLIKPVSAVTVAAKIRAMERICNMRDQLKETHQKLQEATERDLTTNLFTYRTFRERAWEHWKKATKEQKELAILVVDVDHFNVISKKYSYDVAQKVLLKVFHAVAEAAESPQVVPAHMYDDRMIILLPGANANMAKRVAILIQRHIDKLKISYENEHGKKTKLSVTTGISSVMPTQSVHLSQMINITERALKKAQQENRGGYEVSKEIPQKYVLIVDDNLERRSEFMRLLEENFSTISTPCGEDAIGFIEKLGPSIVVVNIESSSFHAGRLIRHLEENPGTASTPVVIIAENRDSSFEMYREKDSVKYGFSMPVNETQFIGSIRACLK